jgi:hypothetical protein
MPGNLIGEILRLCEAEVNLCPATELIYQNALSLWNLSEFSGGIHNLSAL